MHTWFQDPNPDGHRTPIVFHTNALQQGWIVEDEGDHFEVYYTPTERMRIGSDGSLSFGGPKPYVFKTREWAEFCAERLNSLDSAFGRGQWANVLDTSGNFYIGVTPANWSGGPTFQIRPPSQPKPVLTIDQEGRVTEFDLPYFLMGWLRITKAYRVWNKLMWGERGRA